MLDNIIALVREHASEAIAANPAIPEDKKEAATAEAGNSILDGLKNTFAQGRMQDLMSLFNHPAGDMASHPVVQEISGGFVQNLVSKLGIDPSAASGVASGLIPTVLQQLIAKVKSGGDGSFDLMGMIGQLTGGQGLGGLLGSLGQGGAGNTGGAGDAGGGVMDKLKGLF